MDVNNVKVKKLVELYLNLSKSTGNIELDSVRAEHAKRLLELEVIVVKEWETRA